MATHAWRDSTPGFERIFVSRSLDFYNSLTFTANPDNGELQQIDVPTDCDVIVRNQWLFINPRTDFAGVPAGGLGVINFDGTREFKLIFEPSPTTSLQGLSTTKNYLLLTLLDNVSTQLSFIPLSDPTATPQEISLPEHVTAHVVATSPHDGDEIWVHAASFTEPAVLYRAELPSHLEPTKQAPLQWANRGLSTKQHWATSADGTKVPYFISGNFGSAGTPEQRKTLVHAYGGFEVSLTPSHSPTRGIAWLEKGYYFVEANLRGGGEFGPQWHSQATKLNRMKVWEDHYAVLQDLVARGYAKPEQIAIRGGSNGGLLTSGALTQYPESFGAAVVQVPLTDMLRYHTWSAGASWMAEYGNPDDPAERAVLEKYSPLHNVEKRPYPRYFERIPIMGIVTRPGMAYFPVVHMIRKIAAVTPEQPLTANLTLIRRLGS